MQTEKEIKNLVKERYAKIAEQGKAENASSCCGATSPSNKIYNIMMDDYTGTGGYIEDADLGLLVHEPVDRHPIGGRGRQPGEVVGAHGAEDEVGEQAGYTPSSCIQADCFHSEFARDDRRNEEPREGCDQHGDE